MAELIVKEPTTIENLEKKVVELEATAYQKDIELKKANKKRVKHSSIGYFRTRFKGG